jgi:hypothetical protein
VADPLAPAPIPEWIHKRDGRLVPFDTDRISRSLFAATEALGRPDAFLARELTDSILHFLHAEFDVAVPTTAQLAELIAKVVRELGQPALAHAFAEGAARKEAEGKPTTISAAASGEPTCGVAHDAPRWVQAGERGQHLVQRAGEAALRDYSLRAVFTRDLVAAHRGGLLTLFGLETPFELDSMVLGPAAHGLRLSEALENARRLAGRAVVLDGPELAVTEAASAGIDPLAEFARGLELGLRLTGLRAVVPLNRATTPAWANELAAGPLFPDSSRGGADHDRTRWAERLLEALNRIDRACIQWSLDERDFHPDQRARLHRVAEVALHASDFTFVFDRPRKPGALGDGLERGHSAVLARVALHLPALVEELGRRPMQPPLDPPAYLEKLVSLARLALSAGMQKRDFLRRHGQNLPALTRSFFLDRARLVVVPAGLERVVQRFTGESLYVSRTALGLARQIVQRLQEILRVDGRSVLLDAVVDPCLSLQDDEAANAVFPAVQATVEALRAGLRAAGALHAVSERGIVLLPRTAAATVEQLATWLRFTWERTEVDRLRISAEKTDELPAPQPRLFHEYETP